jgi:hypothetical protein
VRGSPSLGDVGPLAVSARALSFGGIMYSRQILMAGSVLVGVSCLFPHAAHAQPMSDSEKIQLLERQTELLQKQLKELKEEVSRAKTTKKKTEEMDTVSAEVPVAPARSVVKAMPPLLPQGVKVTLGGFLAAETVTRQRNEVADMGSPFQAIPYPFSPQYNENEFRASARQSRISLLIEGKLDPIQKLSGYYEMDFLGVGQTSNYNQSNSWAPRLRQAYLDYDNTGYGFHLLAGQAWSLLTQNQVGITPRKENIPLTIDANYVVGFNYTRNWQIRMVEEFGPAFSAGVSVEAPAAIVSASTATTPLGLGGAFASGSLVNGVIVNFNNVGPGSGFLTGTSFTNDVAPDVIAKLAWDPGWGHYEVFGVQRFFSDNVLSCFPVSCVTGSITVTGAASQKITYGQGVGGSVLLPVISKYLDFTGNVMYGRGVGRYGAGQLPDVTIASDGSLSPLTELTAMVGLIAHPYEGLDVYGYAGIEQVNANSFDLPAGTAGGNLFGFGNAGFNNAGCTTTTSSSFGTGAAPVNCIANNRRLSDVTAGFWQNLYKGQYGRLAVGAQWEIIRRDSFTGIGGAPSTNENIVLTSLRWYPF